MNYSKIVVSRLLDKYEKSLHAKGEGLSKRRVLLKTDREDMPEYDYHNNGVRDEFNQSVSELENAGIVMKNWGRKGYVLSEIWLNLDNVESAYQWAGRETPREICDKYIFLLLTLKEHCKTAWILEFACCQINEIQRNGKLTALCNHDYTEFQDLITSLIGYDSLCGENITMRAFSIQCYHDSKYFERHVRDYFLSVARRYNPVMTDNEEESSLGWREYLMIMGVFARPELYELSGDITINFISGSVKLSAFGAAGVALPNTLVGDILDIEMGKIRRIIFIENKTCYDEYILNLKQSDELVFYQGGFISPKKAKLIQMLEQHADTGTLFYFWGDIDIGGFKMFCQLGEYISSIAPWKMDANEVIEYRNTGMERSNTYFSKMEDMQKDPRFCPFYAAIEQSLRYRVTIEQESMLETLLKDSVSYM